MMTETLRAVEPQEEEHAKAAPSAFVRDQPRLDPAAAGESVVLSSAEAQLLRGLVRRTRAAGGDVTGPGGLLKQLSKTVIESALEEELVDHLGYDKYDPAGRNGANALARHRLVGSMGRVGSSGDNAAMESSFALLQKNVLDRHSWTTHEQLRIAIVTWIERTYHRRRRQARLGRLTPIEFETIVNTTVALAAWLGTVTYPCSSPVA